GGGNGTGNRGAAPGAGDLRDLLRRLPAAGRCRNRGRSGSARPSQAAVPPRSGVRRLCRHRLPRPDRPVRADADERRGARPGGDGCAARRHPGAGAGAGDGAAPRRRLGSSVRWCHDARGSAPRHAGRGVGMTVRFRYRAATHEGQVVEGIVQAPSRQNVLEELRRQRLYPLAVDEAASAAATRVSRRLGRRAALTPWTRNAAPALMGVVACVGLLVLLGFVIPRFAAILSDVGGGLPLSTRLLVGASALVTKGWWAWLLLGGAAAYAVPSALARPENRRRWHAARLGWPVVGDLELKYSTAKFARTLGLLLKSGLPIVPALNIARASATNLIVQE